MSHLQESTVMSLLIKFHEAVSAVIRCLNVQCINIFLYPSRGGWKRKYSFHNEPHRLLSLFKDFICMEGPWVWKRCPYEIKPCEGIADTSSTAWRQWSSWGDRLVSDLHFLTKTTDCVVCLAITILSCYIMKVCYCT